MIYSMIILIQPTPSYRQVVWSAEVPRCASLIFRHEKCLKCANHSDAAWHVHENENSSQKQLGIAKTGLIYPCMAVISPSWPWFIDQSAPKPLIANFQEPVNFWISCVHKLFRGYKRGSGLYQYGCLQAPVLHCLQSQFDSLLVSTSTSSTVWVR